MAAPTLATLFNFTAEDLSYNRRGLLSEAQRARQQRRLIRTQLGLIFFGVLLFSVGIIAMLNDGVGFGVAMMGLSALLIAFWVITQGQRQRLQALERVQRVTGPAKLRRSSSMNAGDHPHVSYYLVIKNHEFLISRVGFNHLEKGKTYTVYFIPGLKRNFFPVADTLVSLEARPPGPEG